MTFPSEDDRHILVAQVAYSAIYTYPFSVVANGDPEDQRISRAIADLYRLERHPHLFNMHLPWVIYSYFDNLMVTFAYMYTSPNDTDEIHTYYDIFYPI